MCKKHPRNSTLFRRRPQPNKHHRGINIIRRVPNPFRHITDHRDPLLRRKQLAKAG